MQVWLTKRVHGDEARNRLAAELDGFRGFSYEVSSALESVLVDVDASSRTEAETTAEAIVTAALGEGAVSSVVGKDDTMQNRQVLLWSRGTRLQARRFEIAIARNVKQADARVVPGYDVWDAQIHKHLTLVAANNLLRALKNADDRFPTMAADMATDVRNQRDIHEHWDEQWPAFRNVDKPGPLTRGGITFAERHPGKRPFSFINWSGREGVRLGQGILVTDLYSYLDELDAAVLQASPRLSRFIGPIEPSPWVEGDDPSWRFWPKS
jgi:hypothetical protein